MLDGTVHPTHGWFPHGTDGLEHRDLEAVLQHRVAGDGRTGLFYLTRPRGALPGDLERRHLQRAGGGEEDGCDPHVFFVWQLLLGSAESFLYATRGARRSSSGATGSVANDLKLAGMQRCRDDCCSRRNENLDEDKHHARARKTGSGRDGA